VIEPARAPHKRMPTNFYWDHNQCGWVQAEAGPRNEVLSVPGDIPGQEDHHHSARNNDHVRPSHAVSPQ
jgi:hypothetical protein